MSTADQHKKELREAFSFLGQARLGEMGMEYTAVAELRYTVTGHCTRSKRTGKSYQQHQGFYCVRQRKTLYMHEAATIDVHHFFLLRFLDLGA